MTTTTSQAATVRQRRWLVIGIVCFVALAAGIWATAAMLREETARLNDNAVVLTKFIRSRQFEQLPFEQQRQYYKVLDDRDDELDAAYAARRLSESEYRTGLEAAWLGKHINRVEKYFALPPGQGRLTYINKLLDKKERKKASAGGGNDDGDIDADETAAELRVDKWPSDIRTQWQLFHDAYRVEKKARAKSEARPTSMKSGK